MRVRTLVKTIVFLAVVGGIYFGARMLAPVPVKRVEGKVIGWWRSPRVQSRIHQWEEAEEQEGQGILVRYHDVTKEKANAVRDLLGAARAELATTFQIRFPEKIEVCVYRDQAQGVYFETDGKTEIALSLPRDDDWLPEGYGGRRNHVADVSYVISLWANCFDRSDPSFPDTEFGSSIATFLSWNFVVPAIYRKLQDFAWPYPYKYIVSVNPTRYAELALNPPAERIGNHQWGPYDTFWIHCLQKYGVEKISSSLQQACSLMGDHKIEEIARRIQEETGDPAIAKELLDAAAGKSLAPPASPAPTAPPASR